MAIFDRREVNIMVALDTNILVYYHRVDNKWHKEAKKLIFSLHESGEPWAIPWPCVSEFLAIVTHPRIFDPPTPPDEAMKEIFYLSESPNLYFIGEEKNYLENLQEVLQSSKVTGPRVHDARIAAICTANKVSKLYSLDRDFSRFVRLKVANPF